jgi:short-subunit dehydrogenase
MDKKVVLITGCSTGIGRALSEEFHRCGFRVIATARRLESLSDLQAKGISTHALDVNNKDQVKHVIKAVLHQEKTIDVLVNNAGYALIGPSIEIPEDELMLQFQTNVFSAFFIAREIAPIMRERGNGLIINIGSVSGITTTPFSGAYCASKAALHAFSDALRMELSVFGIKVVTVQPGGIQSQFSEAAKATVFRILKPESWYQSAADAIKSRAELSQLDATPAEEFAKRLVKDVMVKKPPAIIRIGKKSTILPLLNKLVPTSILDEIFKKKFDLIRM